MTKTEFLSASLPYGLMFKNRIDDTIERLSGVDTYITANWAVPKYPEGAICVYSNIDHGSMWSINEITPIVRPLSDLTKECVQADYNDGKPFVPIKIMLNEIIESWAEVGLNYPNDETGLYKDIVSNINYCEYWIIKLLLKWHFDLITEDCEKVYVTDEFNPYK